MAIVHRGCYVFGLLSQSGRYVSFYLLQTWEYNYRSKIQGLWFLLLRSHNAYKWVQINYLLSSWLLGVGNQEYCWISLDWRLGKVQTVQSWAQMVQGSVRTDKYHGKIWRQCCYLIVIFFDNPHLMRTTSEDEKSTDIEADKQNLDNCIYNDKLSTLVFCFQGNGWQHRLGRS